MAVTVQTMKERISIEGFADISGEIHIRFLNELGEQVAIGNKPRAILIDGTRQKRIEAVRIRATAFFGGVDAEKIAKATHMAWDMLVASTRVDTGRARASYALFFKGHRVGGREAIDGIAKTMTENDVLVISGPGVPYGRKLYWRPAGKQRMKKYSRAQKVRVRSGGSVKLTMKREYVQPAHQYIRRALRRKFPELYIDDRWREYGAGKNGVRWPSIAVGMLLSRH